MQLATWLFVAAALCCIFGTEVARSIVDSRRKRRDGFGGTADIYIWGALATVGFTIAAVVSFVISHPRR
jgi:hypothetical protein